MFTGLVEGTGTIVAANSRDGDVEFWVSTPDGFLHDAQIGESICVNGVCLTATEYKEQQFCCDVSNETLQCTTLSQLQPGVAVNLERALLPTSRLGGHIVSCLLYTSDAADE